jgi:hypothetical protein
LLEKNVPLQILTLIMGIGYLPLGLKFVWGGRKGGKNPSI